MTDTDSDYLGFDLNDLKSAPTISADAVKLIHEKGGWNETGSFTPYQPIPEEMFFDGWGIFHRDGVYKVIKRR